MDDNNPAPDEALTEVTEQSVSLYQGRIVNLRRDTVRLPNGRVTVREIVEHSDSVCVVPLDAAGRAVLVRQYRKPTESALLEVPAGGIEAGEGPDAAVLRELQEEIGHTAGKLRHLSSFWLAPGWCDEYMHAYLATELAPARLDMDYDEIIETVRIPLAETPELIARGEIQDAKSIASLLLALRAVNNGN